MSKAIVIYSGGADSLTLLRQVNAMEFYDEIIAVSINYGQRHKIELEYAARQCEELALEHKIIDLSMLRDILSASALTSDMEMPTGHYQAENMKQTVVPNRNAIMINIAAGYAMTIGAKDMYMGAHAGDHYIYPDCRPEFFEAQARVLAISGETPINILTPFLHMDKAAIMRVGNNLDIDYVDAWTCYDPQNFEDTDLVPCGECGSCVERIEAVNLSHAIDTTVYAK